MQETRSPVLLLAAGHCWRVRDARRALNAYALHLPSNRATSPSTPWAWWVRPTALAATPRAALTAAARSAMYHSRAAIVVPAAHGGAAIERLYAAGAGGRAAHRRPGGVRRRPAHGMPASMGRRFVHAPSSGGIGAADSCARRYWAQQSASYRPPEGRAAQGRGATIGPP